MQMGLVLAIVVAVITVGTIVVIIFADSMSDAPSQDGIPIWPTLIVGFGLAGILLLTHFYHFSW